MCCFRLLGMLTQVGAHGLSAGSGLTCDMSRGVMAVA